MPRKAAVPLCDYEARRIALIKPSALGDILHSLPVLTALRRRYPQAQITWIINRAYQPLLDGHPHLDASLAFDRGALRHGWWRGMKTYASFVQQLRRRQFDLVVDLQGLMRTGLMSVATGARRRVGLSSAREGARWTYSDVLAVDDFHAMHAVDRYWLVANALGVGGDPKEFQLAINPGMVSWAERELQGCPRPWIMLAVGSRWVTKRWLPQHFGLLVRQAQEEYGGTAVFVGTDDEAHLARETAGFLAGPFRDLSGATSLPQLAAILSLADVMVANDTGPLHLAAALGRPVVAPYTCTKVRLNGPYGAEASTVEARIWCQGSYLKRCARLECMAELTPDLLWPLLQDILKRWPARSRSA
ncbi:MAG: glycosyltransferase family 9 protein [Gemmataceae bacterium]